MIAPYSNVRDVEFELRERNDASVAAIITLNDDSVRMLSYLRLATTRLTRQIGARFNPNLETKTFSFKADKFTGRAWAIDMRHGAIILPEPMLAEPTLMTDGDGNALTYGTDFVEDPPGQYPTTRFVFLTGSPCLWAGCKTWWGTYTWTPTRQSMVQCTGIWGWNSDYNGAYIDSLDTVQNDPLTNSGKSITIHSVTGADEAGRIPRFSPGQLIKVGEELMLVNTTTPATSTGTLGVSRGQNGTTAVAHLKDAVISIFEPDEAVQQATKRSAAYDYKRRGAYASSEFDATTGVASRYPADMPSTVLAIIDELSTEIWGGESI